VLFTGRLSQAEVDEVYASADIFVLSSVAEPFGLTPLEALSRHVPVIVSRQSGVAEVLESCPKYDSWDTQQLAEHVLTLSRSPALRRQLAEAGRAEIEGMRWGRRAQDLLDIYRELAE
jgi:glycosyltransferase involved in cell wall biosynthesis